MKGNGEHHKEINACHFKNRYAVLAADLVGGSIRKFVYDADGPAFLERELVGLGVDGYW